MAVANLEVDDLPSKKVSQKITAGYRGGKVLDDEEDNQVSSDDHAMSDNNFFDQEISTKVEESEKTSSKKEEQKKPVRKKTSEPSRKDIESTLEESKIDEEKWAKYKKITLVKPIELLEDSDIKNIGIPQNLLQRMKILCLSNPRVQMRTIVTNLILNFLEENKDIIDLVETEYNNRK